MPLTTTSTVVTEVRNTQTVYPTCFIRNAYDPAAYLDHADPEDHNPTQIRLVNIEKTKAWKLDKDNSSRDLLISSAAHGVAVTHVLNDVLALDARRESRRKWQVDRVEAARFRISGNYGEVNGQCWTINSADRTVMLREPVNDDASPEEKLKQQWVFEPIVYV